MIKVLQDEQEILKAIQRLHARGLLLHTEKSKNFDLAAIHVQISLSYHMQFLIYLSENILMFWVDVFYKLLAKSDRLKENTKLIICGGYKGRDRYFQQIKKKISERNLSKNIEITGYIELCYLPSFFEKAKK